MLLLDVVDIFIIAYLLYQGYKFLVDSRAWQVLRGTVLLGVLWLIAVQFHLEATSWLFRRATPVALIAMVVIFQPELRAALERVGQGRYFGRTAMRPSEGRVVVEAIMDAMNELSRSRKGALIAIERHMPLTQYGLVGSALDSPVSAPLLQTIFDSKGPLHDGAVLIRGNTITHAGAIFPVSSSMDGLKAKHGTRHRAALGLSEVTDALVLVVSEERGTVSYAYGGVMYGDVAPTEVRSALREVFNV